jgi:hypothetical protein
MWKHILDIEGGLLHGKYTCNPRCSGAVKTRHGKRRQETAHKHARESRSSNSRDIGRRGDDGEASSEARDDNDDGASRLGRNRTSERAIRYGKAVDRASYGARDQNAYPGAARKQRASQYSATPGTGAAPTSDRHVFSGAAYIKRTSRVRSASGPDTASYEWFWDHFDGPASPGTAQLPNHREAGQW